MENIKVAICLGVLPGSEVDATQIEDGNPGVGGTQFCMLQLIHCLQRCGQFEIHTVSNRKYNCDDGVIWHHIDKYGDLISLCEHQDIDILILDKFSDSTLRRDIEKSNLKVIAWCHNYIYDDIANYLARTEQIKACVFVGKQMYDRYIDHDIILKSTVIYNMFFDNKPNIIRNNDCKTVVYMGALKEGKGFAELCSIWPSIIAEVPDAKLLVLGSGGLYGDASLGELGLAKESYERKFTKYIIDPEGNIIPSVQFLGIVGKEKLEIFEQASVGVVNPSGRTETFGMGVVEMAQVKLPVVTIGKNGHFDTVENGVTGILGNNLSEIKRGIIRLLRDENLNVKLGNAAKDRIEMFSPHIISKEWVNLVNMIHKSKIMYQYARISPPMATI